MLDVRTEEGVLSRAASVVSMAQFRPFGPLPGGTAPFTAPSKRRCGGGMDRIDAGPCDEGCRQACA